jgi:hypothetical protein
MPEQDKPAASPSTGSPQNRSSRPGARGKPQGDGRRDPDQMRRNQESLGVDTDHKTPEMKKKNRGTFP